MNERLVSKQKFEGVNVKIFKIWLVKVHFKGCSDHKWDMLYTHFVWNLFVVSLKVTRAHTSARWTSIDLRSLVHPYMTILLQHTIPTLYHHRPRRLMISTDVLESGKELPDLASALVYVCCVYDMFVCVGGKSNGRNLSHWYFSFTLNQTMKKQTT